MSASSITRRNALKGMLATAPMADVSRTTGGGPIVFQNVTVIDGTGAKLPDRTVVVRKDRIAQIGPAASIIVPAAARVMDGNGRFLIPGLWDAHGHLSYFKGSALAVLVANGVTSIRDMGGLPAELDEWKTEIDGAMRPGPRIFRAGPILNGKSFNEFQVAVEDAAEARGAVRVLAKSSVDFIKVHAAISRDAYFGVQTESRKLGLPYVGHMPRAITPEEASDAGQRTLEHVGAFVDRFAYEGVAPNEMAAALERFRKEKARQMFDRFAKNGTWFTPTLIVSKAAIHLGDHQPDPRDRYVSASCKRITQELLTRPSYQELLGPEAIRRQEREFEELLRLVHLLRECAVSLLAGTDFAVSIVYPGFSLHDELELLVTAGLTPMEALMAATANPARVLGQTDLGIIGVGKLADMVLLGADPLEDIRNTKRVDAVVSRGELFDQRHLSALLEGAAEEAART